MTSTTHATLHAATRPTSPFAQLLRKELRLQRGNFLFAFATTLLGIILLPLIATNSQTLGGYPPRDIQVGLLMVGLLPVLLIILPAMIGSTAAAAEKPIGVLAWQSALPISRRKVVATKFLVISLLCFIVSGIFPYMLQQLSLEPQLLSQGIRGFWAGWHGLFFGAIGFFAGSFTKDDYQGLLVSIVPAALLVGICVLADPFFRVAPFTNLPLSRPWVVILRLLLIIALLIILATPLHNRIAVRRWRWLTASLAILMCTCFVLTLVNIHIEGHVLTGPQIKTEQSIFLKNLPATITQSKTRQTVTFTRGWSPHPTYPQTLDSRDRMFINQVTYPARYVGLESNPNSPNHSSSLKIGTASTIVVTSPDGITREFPQLLVTSDVSISGISENNKWLLLSEAGKDIYLCGPMSISIPLHLLPASVSNTILDRMGMHYNISDGSGWGMALEKLKPGPKDVYLKGEKGSGYVIRNGADKFPQGSTLNIYSYITPGVYQVQVKVPGERLDKSYSVMLRNGKTRGELEIVGFINGDVDFVSSDGEWVAAGDEHGTVYRRVQPLEKALSESPLSKFYYQSSRRFFSTTALDNGTTRVTSGLLWTLPIIDTPDGPATILKYVTGASVKVTTQVIQQQTFYKNEFICDDFGVDIVNLENSTTTSISLKLPGEVHIALPQIGVNAMVYQATAAPIFLISDWFQPSQTLSLTANGIVRFADFTDYKTTQAPRITVAPTKTEMWDRNDGGILSRGKFLQVDGSAFWLSKW